MTAITLNNYYCAVCAWVAKQAKRIVFNFELAGYERAATEMTRLGYFKEARELMIMKNKLMENQNA